MATKKSAEEEPDFETSLTRLEKIVKEMEEGSMGLDQMMQHFEEGMNIVKFCSGKLNEVERKIEILAKKSGETVAEPFDEEEA